MGFEVRVLAIVFAVALQVQTTLAVGDAGIRVAVSDLFLPISLIYIAFWLIPSPARLQWRMPAVWWWLLGITVAMSISLFKGSLETGQWSSWALLNKWAGWFALVSYLVVGATILRVGGTDLREQFLTTFLATAAVIGFLNSMAMPWLLDYYTLPFGIEFGRATGGMQNANAFGFLVAVAALLAMATRERLYVYLPPLLVALWFSSSRGAALAFITGAIVYVVLSPRRLVPTLKAIAIAAIAVAAVTTVSIAVDSDVAAGKRPIGFFSAERLDPDAATIKDRQVQNERAVDLLMKAPLFGQGLGTFVEKTGTTLHNSALWLLLETGLVGTLLFSGFLLMAVRCLYLSREDPFLLGMLAVSLAFTVMSMTGEFLYQRHLWLLLGLALASPPPRKGRP